MPDWLDELEGLARRIEGLRRQRAVLRCVECGVSDDGRRRGWTLRVDVGDELQPFCPDCDWEEFGRG